MGWGIDFKPDIYLSKQDYGEDVSRVNDAIEEKDKWIKTLETKLAMMASAKPKDIVPKEWKEETINWLNKEVEEILEDYSNTVVERYVLKLYKEYLLEEKNDEKEQVDTP